MKRREEMYLIGGLLIGFLIGAVLIGTSADLRTSIFGTAVGDDDTESNDAAVESSPLYILLDYNQAQDWLTGAESIEVTDDLEDNLAKVAELTAAPDFTQYYTDSGALKPESALKNVLSLMHSTLLKELKLDSAEGFQLCLTLNNDPYSLTGPVLYFFVQMPADAKENVPEGWEENSGPLEDSMLWSTQCYAAED